MNTLILLTYFKCQCLFVLLFMHLFTWRLTYVGVSPTRQPHWGVSLAGICYCDLPCVGAGFTLLKKHQKFREMGSCFLFMSLGALNYKGAFVSFSFFIRVLFWNFACSAFLMVLQRNRMFWEKIDNSLSLYLQHGQFSFCLPVWFFPDELMVKWVNVKGKWTSNAEMFPISHKLNL